MPDEIVVGDGLRVRSSLSLLHWHKCGDQGRELLLSVVAGLGDQRPVLQRRF